MAVWSRSILGVAMLVAVTALKPAAARSDPADLCTLYIARVERSERLPPGLLHAIALVETGRWRADGRGTRPWPWTVTSAEQSYYLPTIEAALRTVRQLQADGRTNIDVGCMQINLRHHGDALKSPDAALHPATNVAYAAAFLKELEAETKSWRLAVGYYHSRNPKAAAAYYAKVSRLWPEEQRWSPLPAAGGAVHAVGDGFRLAAAHRRDRAATVQELVPLADVGDPDAQQELADRYARGDGVAKDHVQALKWYMLAALHGKPARSLPLREIRSGLTPEQVRQAQELVLFWNPRRPTALQWPRRPDFADRESDGAQPSDLMATVQRYLAELGYDPGPVDGIGGPRTRAAIRRYQADAGDVVTGVPTEELAKRLAASFARPSGGLPAVPVPAAKPAVSPDPCPPPTALQAHADDVLARGYELYLREEFEQAGETFRRVAEAGDPGPSSCWATSMSSGAE